MSNRPRNPAPPAREGPPRHREDLSADDQRRYQRWVTSLGCVCKVCEFRSSGIPSFVSHLRDAHNLTTQVYTGRYGPYTNVHKCKLCSTDLNGGVTDLHQHLITRHNGMTITSYFISHIKPTLAERMVDAIEAAARRGAADEQAPAVQDMSFLESLAEWSDFQVELESGEKIKCHKVTLAKWSPTLEAMLKTACVETQKGEIKIRGYDERTVKVFIEYLYQGKIDASKYTIELLRICDQYQVKRFFTESFKSEGGKTSTALKTLIRAFKDDNVVEFWQMAEIHGEPNLKEAALQYMIKKGKKLLTFKGMENIEADRLKTLLAYALDHPRSIPSPHGSRDPASGVSFNIPPRVPRNIALEDQEFLGLGLAGFEWDP